MLITLSPTSRKWTSEAVEDLQPCLDSTDWDAFRTATNSLDEYTEDHRKNSASPAPITLCDSTIDTVESFCFLGTIISQDLKWELNTSSLIKKAQQRMYFLRQLKKFNLPKTMMVHFYTAIIESILTSSITIWYAAATAKDKGRLQSAEEKVIDCNLPSLQDLYTSRTLRRAGKIVADPSHPGHKLFETLSSGRRLRSIRTKTSRHENSFFPSAVSLINKARNPRDTLHTPSLPLLSH